MVLEKDLTFLCHFGLNDDLRDGVEEICEKFKRAQCNVRIVSGDNLLTCVEAARKAQILEPEEDRIEMVCMEGADFRE